MSCTYVQAQNSEIGITYFENNPDVDYIYTGYANNTFDTTFYIRWQAIDTTLFEISKLVNIYIINKDSIDNNGNYSLEQCMMVAKDVKNNGSFVGKFFYSRPICKGIYHIVIATPDGSIKTISLSKIKINRQIVSPRGGEVFAVGDGAIKMLWVNDSIASLNNDMSEILFISINNSMHLNLGTVPNTGMAMVPINSSMVANDWRAGLLDFGLTGNSDFEIIDTLFKNSIMYIDFESFNNLNALDGKYVVPRMNAVFEGLETFAKIGQEDSHNNISDMGPLESGGGILGNLYGCDFSHSSITQPNAIGQITTVRYNTQMLHHRLYTNFILDYTIDDRRYSSGGIDCSYCFSYQRGQCPIRGFIQTTNQICNCFFYDSNVRGYSLSDGYTASYCGGQVYPTLVELSRNIYNNITPAHLSLLLKISSAIPSKNPILLSPNGLERLALTDAIAVSWINPFYRADPDLSCNIYISSDNGATYEIFKAHVPSPNIVNKTIIDMPEHLSDGNAYKVKIVMSKNHLFRLSADNINAFDESDTSFTIVQSNNMLYRNFLTLTNVTHTSCNLNNGSIQSASVDPLNRYLWSTGETTTFINNLAPGIYYLTVTDTSNYSAIDTIQVLNSSANQASLDVVAPTCGNNNARIHINNGSNIVHALWSNGDTSIYLQNIIPGNYSCTVTDNSGCTATLSTTVPNSTALIANIINVTPQSNTIPNGSIDIEVNNIHDCRYTWSNGATTQDISNLASGIYYCTIADYDTDCLTEIGPINISSVVGLNEINIAKNIHIYPNPAQNSITIQCFNFDLINKQYAITDISGKILHQNIIQNLSNTIDISHLSNGLYFIKIGNESMKFLKQ